MAYPEHLLELYTFKTSKNEVIPEKLVMLLLNITAHIDLDTLDHLLYTGRSSNFLRSERNKIYMDIITNKMKWKKYAIKDDKLNSLGEKNVINFKEHGYFLEILDYDSLNISNELKNDFENLKIKILRNKKSNHKLKKIESKLDLPVNTEPCSEIDFVTLKRKSLQEMGKKKKTSTSLNITKAFNLTKVETIQETKAEHVRFLPIKTNSQNKFVLHDPRFNKRFTFRKRKEIVNPIRLTFIKFHDQIRPPIYSAIEKTNQRITFKKINQVQDYDYDSDAEWIYEDGDDIDMSDETETEEYSESEDNEWIDKEGEEAQQVETKKVYMKPEVIFTPTNFIFFKEFNDSYLELPLARRNFIPEDLIELLTERTINCKNKEELCRKFSSEYRIINSVVIKKMKEISSVKENSQDTEATNNNDAIVATNDNNKKGDESTIVANKQDKTGMEENKITDNYEEIMKNEKNNKKFKDNTSSSLSSLEKESEFNIKENNNVNNIENDTINSDGNI